MSETEIQLNRLSDESLKMISETPFNSMGVYGKGRHRMQKASSSLLTSRKNGDFQIDEEPRREGTILYTIPVSPYTFRKVQKMVGEEIKK